MYMIGYRQRRALRAVGVLLAGGLALGALGACASSSTRGQGSAGTATSSSAPLRSAGGPAPTGGGLQQPVSGSTRSGGASGGGAPVATSRPISVVGTSGQTYAVNLWSSSTVTDCAAHSYGTKVPAFLRTHPCRSAHRVLVTVPYNGRTAVLSEVDVDIPAAGADPYKNASGLATLERADGTGGLNGLLREGVRIPGVASAIPFREAFEVYGQDTGVTIFDAWWQSGATADQDPKLVQLEMDLYLTSLGSA
jgi:hypothetical protein